MTMQDAVAKRLEQQRTDAAERRGQAPEPDPEPRPPNGLGELIADRIARNTHERNNR